MCTEVDIRYAGPTPVSRTVMVYNGPSPMAPNPTNPRSRGALHSLYDWLRRVAPIPRARTVPVPVRADPPPSIGRYAITGKLGEGGMGIVYAARDERLGRRVAVKTMSSPGGDAAARERFWREARAAASVNHPNVCQLYEIGEDRGRLYIAMEFLEGESLADRIRRGPLNVNETLPIALGILAALSALHARSVIHRDLKPSNVFLTPHGAKVLDFGLARTNGGEPARSLAPAADLTRTGMVVGTPRYMAPEQVTGGGVDGRADLFAVGAIVFEMLAGRPAFGGRSVIEVLHATVHEHPPALSGSPAVAAVDRVIRRAMAKRASERPASADAMADELRVVRGVFGDDTPAVAQALTRLVVLPFRVLRADPETDFLGVSLADAIGESLARFAPVIVRSSASAARFAGEAPDLKALAVEADVDRVVMGTLLRSGDQLRAAVQLVETPAGTLLASHSIESSLGDLFRLQDDIARRVVEALSLPLAGASSPTPEAPGDAGAYRLYLRANALARSYEQLPEARELYRRCLEIDPGFAPAWAQLGRCHRVIGKYIEGGGGSPARTEEALRRALELSPRLTVAHKFYANLEADTGQAIKAVVRLLGEAGRHGNDPELFAGLVHACRYCGLFEQSVAAHDEARRLDPNVATSLDQTLLMAGELERLIAVAVPSSPIGSGDEGLRVIALGLAGRREEARRGLLDLTRASRLSVFRSWSEFLHAWLDRRPADMTTVWEKLDSIEILDDPEAIFLEGWLYCDAGEIGRGLGLLQRGVGKGYFVAATLAESRSFDALRTDPAFQRLLEAAEAGRAQALAAFRAGGGERILGR